MQNTDGLIRYLAEFDIDAKRIPTSSVTEEGFDYYVVDKGRPVYGADNRLMRERRKWPSKLVYVNVQLLLNGAGVADLKADRKPKEDTKEAPAP